MEFCPITSMVTCPLMKLKALELGMAYIGGQEGKSGTGVGPLPPGTYLPLVILNIVCQKLATFLVLS